MRRATSPPTAPPTLAAAAVAAPDRPAAPAAEETNKQRNKSTVRQAFDEVHSYREAILSSQRIK